MISTFAAVEFLKITIATDYGTLLPTKNSAHISKLSTLQDFIAFHPIQNLNKMISSASSF